MSVLRRFYVRLSIVLLILLASLGALHIRIASQDFEQRQVEIDQRVNRNLAADMAAEIEPHLQRNGGGENIGSVIHYMMVLNPAIEIYVLDERGNIRAFFAEPPKKVEATRVDIRPIRRFLREDAELPILGDDPRHPGARKHFSASPLDLAGGEDGYLYIVLRSSRYDEARRALEASSLTTALRRSFLVALPLVAALGLGIFFVLTRRLQRLTEVVRAFGEGGTSRRAPVGSRDEIGELARSFNQMADTLAENRAALERADRERRELVASISHDLRTPLASIRGYTETLIDKDQQLSASERLRYLRIAQRRLELLTRLVEDLFDLSKLQTEDARPAAESFSLSDLIQDVVVQLLPTAQALHVSLKAVEPDSSILIEGDIRLLDRALSNLVTNALHHTPAGGEVLVYLETRSGRVRVSVSDSGVGIQPEATERIFESFYTGDHSRSSPQRGSGLGLAIAKRIVELHGGEIGVDTAPDEGSTFYFELPKGNSTTSPHH